MTDTKDGLEALVRATLSKQSDFYEMQLKKTQERLEVVCGLHAELIVSIAAKGDSELANEALKKFQKTCEDFVTEQNERMKKLGIR